MRVLIVSEGAHELGKAEHERPLGILVERLRGHHVSCDSITVRHPGLVRVHGKGEGMFKKAVACLRYAERQGYEAVVLVIDQDDDVSRRKQLERAQEDAHFEVRRAMGVAIRTFDAWMVADEKALSEALNAVVQTQPNPEEMADAKAICRGFCDEHGYESGLTGLYAAMAEKARLEVLEERCGDGFGVFARRVRGM